ncbi:GlcG/HbpS family heme-binding protein [Granulicella sibirica]|uniref:GlcG/HbpS family heme-binding protein n=1 Tax=Granulicella sibirica TaxID=2479048 RepID=UPI001008D7A4|nr:heme-binding protein [Granulicella sibirica]
MLRWLLPRTARTPNSPASTITRASARLLCGTILLLTLASCGSSVNTAAVPVTTPNDDSNILTQSDVINIVSVAAASVNTPMVIAVSDRRGVILAVYKKASAPVTTLANFKLVAPSDEVAAALARTAAFFSNDQAPIGSRTVRFISGIHFPPGVINTESAPLYGIENTNRGCGFNTNYLPGQSFASTTLLHSTAPGLGIITGKGDIYDSDPNAVNPGGVPIFKNNRVAGAIGVVADPSIPNYNGVVEYAAVAGTVLNGFAPVVPYPGAVVVNGITLPFVNQTTIPTGYSLGISDGSYTLGPFAGSGAAPEGDLIQEHASSLGGLTLAQVNQIVQNAVATGNTTRAAIRLPVGARARFVIAVADLDGSLLALYRMPDATIFSVDVAVAKSRNVIYFSGTPNPADLPGVPTGTAVTNRTLDFASQPLYPEGIDFTSPGPFFTPLFLKDLHNPCTQGSQPKNANQNGIVFFPGSVPLYLNGKLVGGLGVSGDGVDQDDYATAGGAVGFEAPTAIRADNYFDQGVRLTYQKFPPNPTD